MLELKCAGQTGKMRVTYRRAETSCDPHTRAETGEGGLNHMLGLASSGLDGVGVLLEDLWLLAFTIELDTLGSGGRETGGSGDGGAL